MTKRTRVATTTTFAALLLALLALSAVAVQAAPVDISGELTQADDGTFMLVDGSSGESVALKPGPGIDLAGHVDTTVKLTGEWGTSDDGVYFSVTKITPGT